MRLVKDVLAIVFNGLAEMFDRLASACEDHSGDRSPRTFIKINSSDAGASPDN